MLYFTQFMNTCLVNALSGTVLSIELIPVKSGACLLGHG